MQNNAFQPFGPTYRVDTTGAVQCKATNGLSPTSYRIRNSSASINFISWASPLPSGQIPPIAAAPPTVSSVAVNTIGMIGNSVEVFVLPGNAWFTASADNAEITPGEGI